MKKVFFIADTHFGDGQIIKYENRPFNSINQMDLHIIDSWNQTVTNDDQVFFIGDFAIPNQELIKKYIKLLNGYKTIILGNHDKELPFEFWKNSGFDEVSNYPIIINDFFILSHEPVYVNSNMPYANIFGHVHSNPLYKKYSAQSFCVSCERINYAPIEYNDVFAAIKSAIK